jgi:hypothetical protein
MIHFGDNHSTIVRGILPLRKSTETTNTLKAWNREKTRSVFKRKENVISVIKCSPVTMMYYKGILVFVAL